MTITTAERTEIIESIARRELELAQANDEYERYCAEQAEAHTARSADLRYARSRHITALETSIAKARTLLANATVETDPEPPAPAVTLRELVRGTNMNADWFDAAVGRAMAAGLTVYATGETGTAYVDSESTGTLHTVSRDACTCKGFAEWHRCQQVALYIAWTEAFRSEPLPNPLDAGRRMIVRAAA